MLTVNPVQWGGGKMGLSYGTGSTLVKAQHVQAYYTNNMTNISAGDINGTGGYEFYSTNTQGGCGNPNGDAGVLIVLKDDIAWNRISCEMEFNGTASCWTFLGGGNDTNSAQDQNSGYGRSGPNVPGAMSGSHPYNSSSPGNIWPYNENLGDKYFWDVNSFSSNSNFQRQAHACDNNSDNMFHTSYTTTRGTKSFWTRRRRNENGNQAGIWFGRSCSSTGSYIIIKNIFIWYEAQ